MLRATAHSADNSFQTDQGKLAARRGRKARGLPKDGGGGSAAGSLPQEELIQWLSSVTRVDQPFIKAIRADAAWTRATGRGVGVAVIDTGIAGDVPDFRTRAAAPA